MDPTDETPDDAGGEDPTAESGAATPTDDGQELIEQINILPALIAVRPKWIANVAQRVIASAKEDDEGRQDYLKHYAAQLKLFAGDVKKLGYPAQGADAPHISIMTKSVLHSWARIVDEVVPAKGDIVHASSPTGPSMTGQPDVDLGASNVDRPTRIERHMNWQLRSRIPEWAPSHQFTILNWLIAGSTFRSYRWDPITRNHEIEHVPVDDCIVSYTLIDPSPQMRKAERVTIVRRMARWELEKYAAAGFYSNLEDIFPDLKDPDKADDSESGSTTDGDTTPSSDDDDSPVREAADKIQGVEPQKKKSRFAKREVYEQHTFLTFPKGIDIEGLDGETKPVIISVDKQTKKPLAIIIREEPDPIDQERFNQETAAFQQSMQNIAQMSAQAPPGPDGQPAPAPLPPKQPRPVQMQTVYRNIHYGLFPNPNGFYRMGLGSLLEGSNELANVLTAEYMLSAKFSNLITGAMARGSKEKRGDTQLVPGKIMEMEVEPELLDKAIKFFEFHPPSQGLMNVVEKLEANAEIGASADILSGEKGASNETAKGTSIRNANAMAIISVMTRLYLDPLKYELKLIAHSNSINMDETEYFPFVDQIPGPNGQPQVTQQKIGRADYVEDVHLELTADARMISKPERISDAQAALQMILQSPLQENVMLVDFAMRKYFEVSEGFDYLAKMGPPPQPPPPPTPQSQDTENAGFINEKDHPVLPDDNHLVHLKGIDELKQSPLHEHMSATGKQLLDRHQRAHIAQFYLQLQAEQAQTGIPIHELAKQVGLGRVAPGPAGYAPPGQGGGGPGAGPQAPPNGSPNGA